MNKAGEVDFSRVHTVNLDEYCGIPGTHDQSYRYFMDTNLFDHINIDKKNTFVASGMGDFEANARELEEKVREGGAADLQLLGIGNNGHIAFNEASDHLIAVAHTEKLTESTINANARFFEKKKRTCPPWPSPWAWAIFSPRKRSFWPLRALPRSRPSRG